MKNSDSPIHIHIIDATEGTRRFAPGETISGSVEIDPHHPLRCQAVEIQLLWYTEGKGRRDEGLIAGERYEVRGIDPHEGFRERFDFTLPSAPWSYAGHYINIVWVIHVKIDIPLATDLHREARFLLLPSEIMA